jgi:predicted Zn-dependent protease with MMP-like domain
VREILRAPLKAAAVAGFVVGVLLLMVNPPSLSGAGELVSLLAGAMAIVIFTAWATVTLSGRQELSEREFERVVRRSEALARRAPVDPDFSEFAALVADAIDRLPEEFQGALEKVPVVVSHRGRELGAYGRYYGDTIARDDYPDRIVLYQDTLERDFGHDPGLLEFQVERTLRHELAHHLGWPERGVRELGL